MKQIISIFLLASLFGLIVGLIKSGSNTAASQVNGLEWVDPAAPSAFSAEANLLADRLKSVGHFGNTTIIQVQADDPIEPEPEIIAFPHILAVSDLNGEMHVSLRLRDGTLLLAKTGDVLEGGWALKEITMQDVTVDKDGNVTEFKVYPIPNTQQP